MAFDHTGRRNTDEPGLRPELVETVCSAIAHAGPHAANQLVNEIGQHSFVRHAALDAFGNQLAHGGSLLAVSVRAAHDHGPERSHAAIGLERSPVVDDQLARALVQTGQQASQHDAGGPGRQGLGDVARVADTTISYNRHTGGLGFSRTLEDGPDLGHAYPADDAGRADASRPDADLDGVGPGFDQVADRLGRADIAGHELNVVLFLDRLDGLDNVFRVAVSRVDDNDVGVLIDQRIDAVVLVNSDGRPGQEPPAPVAAGLGKPRQHVGVPHGDQADQVELLVHQRQLLDAMANQNAFGLFERRPLGGRDQVLMGHDLLDPRLVRGHELQIAPGQDADQLAALDDRDAGDVVRLHRLAGRGHRDIRGQGDRVGNDPVGAALDLADLAALLLDA